MNDLQALEQAYRNAERVIAAVTPDDYGRPTTCTEWDVRALLDHMIGAITIFPAMLRGEPPDLDRDFVGSDPASSFRAEVEPNLEAWRAPGALETTTEFLPGVRLVELNVCDSVVHTWDLATSTDQGGALPDDLAERTYSQVKEWPLEISRSSGAFGPEIPLTEGASVGDRLLALLGREPCAGGRSS